MATRKRHSLQVDCVFGCSLEKGVSVIGISTCTISAAISGVGCMYMKTMKPENGDFNSDPMLAMDLIFVMYCITVSIYQFIISALLLCYNLLHLGTNYVYTLWLVSNITIIFFHVMIFCARISVAIVKGYSYVACITILDLILYLGVFLYFLMAVNSYIVKSGLTTRYPLSYEFY